MIHLSNTVVRDVPMASSCNLRLMMIRPPVLRLLPPRRMLWLPRLFPAPVVVAQADLSNPDNKIAEPLLLPELPPLDVESSGSTEQKVSAPGTVVGGAPKPLRAASQAPDYTAPQTIVSDVANPVNHIQTIMRPDLVTPPNLKFPLRLQTVVMLPSSAAPVLAPRAPDEPTQPTAPTVPSEQVPLIKAIVKTPVLTLTTKHGSVIRSKTAPAQTVSPNMRALSGTQLNALKALVIVNAVNVAPDPSVAVPEAELAGKFAVGPSRERAGAEKPSPLPGTEHASSLGSVPTPGDSGGLSTGTGSGEPDTERRNVGLSASPKSGVGTETGSPNGGSSIGAGGSNSVSGTPGISISGGGSARSRATISHAFPQRPSYPLMIISGGSSGGASRDLGAFSRNETVYSVSIPMADAGGGPDWTMQYALLNPGQAGAGLLVPPSAQKKVVAAIKSSSLSAEADPIFVTAVIDENGKLQSLKSIRAQDPRSQVALRALAQWEFLPAQLDGKPVASKILLGIAVIVVE
jgi:hypothetical protein